MQVFTKKNLRSLSSLNIDFSQHYKITNQESSRFLKNFKSLTKFRIAFNYYWSGIMKISETRSKTILSALMRLKGLSHLHLTFDHLTPKKLKSLRLALKNLRLSKLSLAFQRSDETLHDKRNKEDILNLETSQIFIQARARVRTLKGT